MCIFSWLYKWPDNILIILQIFLPKTLLITSLPSSCLHSNSFSYKHYYSFCVEKFLWIQLQSKGKDLMTIAILSIYCSWRGFNGLISQNMLPVLFCLICCIFLDFENTTGMCHLKIIIYIFIQTGFNLPCTREWVFYRKKYFTAIFKVKDILFPVIEPKFFQRWCKVTGRSKNVNYFTLICFTKLFIVSRLCN